MPLDRVLSGAKGPSVSEYIAKQPREKQATLRRIRAAIRKGAPRAEEEVRYQMPAYRLPSGKVILYFAAWKRHYSLYPATKSLLAALREELLPYAVSRGTIRFPCSHPVPFRLVERIARLRMREGLKGAGKARTHGRRASGRPSSS